MLRSYYGVCPKTIAISFLCLVMSCQGSNVPKGHNGKFGVGEGREVATGVVHRCWLEEK